MAARVEAWVDRKAVCSPGGEYVGAAEEGLQERAFVGQRESLTKNENKRARKTLVMANIKLMEKRGLIFHWV